MAFDYLSTTLAEILVHVKADGVVDQGEVDGLRARLYADGVIDRDEANLLFDLNDVTTGNSGHYSGWQPLFVEAISSHVLQDETSPGEVDDAEATWLVERIQGDGQLDANEKALLAEIKAKATKIAAPLLAMMDSANI